MIAVYIVGYLVLGFLTCVWFAKKYRAREDDAALLPLVIFFWPLFIMGPVIELVGIAAIKIARKF